ncbi:MAG: ABC transporter permease [Planctomycetaceae bacterium]|nr:ABC transporter permease [Planctomycetaceae bacterium]
MKGKLFGIFMLLVALCTFMTLATSDPWWNIKSSLFLQPGNIQNLLSRTSLYGILGIGVAFVIITGGIDLSIGSTVCLSGVLLAMFLQVDYHPAEQFSVSDVNAAAHTIVVSGDASSLSPGDRVRYSGGRSKSILFTIEAINQTGSQWSITTKEAPSRDETQGELTPTIPVISATREEGKKAATVILGKTDSRTHTIKLQDQINLVGIASGLSTQEVTAVEVKGGTTVYSLRNDPGDRITNDCVAIPMHRHQRMSIPVAILSVLAIAATLGLIHGLLITRARLQPFVVTLCGLLIYRGLSRWLTSDNPAGFGEFSSSLGTIATGRLPIVTHNGQMVFGLPYPLFFLVIIGTVAAVFLGRTIWGRYLLALGRNEEAARFSGINTGRVTLIAYVICTSMAAVGGMLFSLDSSSISPSSFGNFFELYAIAAAVLGGCSLRGGEGSIVGVVIGTAVMQVLNNLIMLLKISGTLEYAIIGSVILLGVLADEAYKRIAAQRRLRQKAG